jgi:hypothetical protein
MKIFLQTFGATLIFLGLMAAAGSENLVVAALLASSATVPQPSKDGCASSRRLRPFSSLKTAIRRSDTIHKSPQGDAPGQPKSLRNRRFCRVSFTRTMFWLGRNDFATKV